MTDTRTSIENALLSGASVTVQRVVPVLEQNNNSSRTTVNCGTKNNGAVHDKSKRPVSEQLIFGSINKSVPNNHGKSGNRKNGNSATGGRQGNRKIGDAARDSNGRGGGEGGKPRDENAKFNAKGDSKAGGGTDGVKESRARAGGGRDNNGDASRDFNRGGGLEKKNAK